MSYRLVKVNKKTRAKTVLSEEPLTLKEARAMRSSFRSHWTYKVLSDDVSLRIEKDRRKRPSDPRTLGM
jgi:hypothetical protein